MKNVEIEKKYLVRISDVKFDYKKYPSIKIIQGFIYLKPAIRVRKSNDKYYLTVKDKPPKEIDIKNDLARTEFEIEITKKAFNDLLKLCKGRIIYKTRYLIPHIAGGKRYTIEFDVFEKALKGLFYAEIEFKTVKEALKFKDLDWFYRDVTGVEKYKNTQLSICKNLKNIIQY